MYICTEGLLGNSVWLYIYLASTQIYSITSWSTEVRHLNSISGDIESHRPCSIYIQTNFRNTIHTYEYIVYILSSP